MMRNKKLILTGIFLGVCVFIAAELFSFAYVLGVMQLVPTGSEWTPINGFLTFSTKIVHWICRPFSSILKILFGSYMRGLLKIYFVNIIGWVAVSILILNLKNRKLNNAGD